MKWSLDFVSLKCKYNGDGRRRILTAANFVFSEIGYEETTMEMIAERSGLSLQKLSGQFTDKQNILDELVGHHIDVHEGIRAFTRTNPKLSPLQSFHVEWELLCEYMSHHIKILQAYKRNESECAPWIRERIELHQNQDVELLEKARDLGELPPVNIVSLEAVLRGTAWRLILESARKPRQVDFASIPKAVSSMIVEPLMHDHK